MMIRKTVLAAIASLAIGAALPAIAADGHDHKEGEAHDQKADHGHDDKSHYEKKSFGTVKEAWAYLSTSAPEAEKLIGEKKLEPVHEIGEQLDAAIHTLEEKSDMVTAENKTKLTALLKQLEKTADDLHHAAEKNDEAGAMLSVKKMKGLLPVVASLYPQGTL